MSDTSPKQELTVKISPSILVFALLIGGGLWLAMQIRAIIFMTLIAYIISVGLNKGIDKLEQALKCKRWVGVLLVYAFFLIVLLSSLSLILPPLLKEFSNLLYNIQLPNNFQNELINFEVNLDSVKSLMDTFGKSIGTALTLISSTFSGAFVAITTLVVALYFSLEKPRMVDDLAGLVSQKRLEELRKFFYELDNQLGNWIRGEIILMTIIGLMTFVGLTLLKIPYALPLALVAGLLEIVPNIGPILSAMPAIAVAYLVFGWPIGLATAGLYILVQQLENNLIVPKIMRSNVDINPLISILGILIGAKIFGVAGALLAVPIFIIMRTILLVWKKHS